MISLYAIMRDYSTIIREYVYYYFTIIFPIITDYTRLFIWNPDTMTYTVIWRDILGIYPHIPCPDIWGNIPGIWGYILFPKVYTEYIQVYTFPEKYMTSYDGIGISRYMLVYGRHIPGIWQNFSTHTGHGYWYSWYKTSCIWYMLAHPAQFCSQMLSWLVYACSSCSAFFPAAPGWPAWMRHICCARKAR